MFVRSNTKYYWRTINCSFNHRILLAYRIVLKEFRSQNESFFREQIFEYIYSNIFPKLLRSYEQVQHTTMIHTLNSFTILLRIKNHEFATAFCQVMLSPLTLERQSFVAICEAFTDGRVIAQKILCGN